MRDSMAPAQTAAMGMKERTKERETHTHTHTHRCNVAVETLSHNLGEKRGYEVHRVTELVSLTNVHLTESVKVLPQKIPVQRPVRR